MKKIFILAITAVLLMSAEPASAHVLVTDETQTKGAVLHIIPDDDPIAGEESMIYFDTQTNLIDSRSSVQLTIGNPSGETEIVPATIDESLITAPYIFPLQGVYDLEFSITTNQTTVLYKQSQRISRGISESPLDQPSHPWAEILLISSCIGFLILIIIGINRRTYIAKSSTF